MSALENFVRLIDSMNEHIGRFVSWFTLVTVIICFVVVVLRYAFGVGILWLQELYVWSHAIVFMVGAGYTMLHGGHVRVDIFYDRLDVRKKAWTNIFGTIVFLLPWLAVVTYYGFGFFEASYRVDESSPQGGGMPALYVLKSMILVFCFLVGLQGLALIGRSILILKGHADFLPAPEEFTKR